MVNSSKVLTASYGTFSCTLEGFDDSFDTMKAIAEYFRDLAADDRYFGAEPPTPDADMLARIAEREVSRRVEAHRDGDKFVLRTAAPFAQLETPEDADAITSSEDAEKQAKAAAELEQSRLAEVAEQEARAQEEQLAKEAEERTQARAARRARIAEAKAKAEAEAKEEAEAQQKAEEEKKAAAQKQSDEEAAMLAERSKHDQAEPDSVAAKLARIRAIVGQPATPPAAPAYSEDEHADDIMQGQPGDTDLEDILDLEDAPDDQSASDLVVDDAPQADANDAISNVMSKLNTETSSATLPDFDADLDENLDAELDADPEESKSTPVAETTVADTPKAPIRARVIKMKREEFEAAVASGDIEEELNDLSTEQAQTDVPVQDSSLSRDDEDELARELAAVEAELAGAAVVGEPAPQYITTEQLEPLELTNAIETPVAPTSSVNIRGVDDLVAEPDVEMDRLMDQTSSELNEPDGKKRRNALGHLRAAVASARADKRSSPQASSVDETQSYRDDLQSAVQPRRPVRRLGGDDTAASAARPPLKLVEEQRVDTAQADPVAASTEASVQVARPVRPRRIKAGETQAAAPQDIAFEVAPEGGTFSQFAEELGATELPDLLEAAAAYLAYVEGLDQFSRPQLMTKVRMVQEDNFSREDGLRSFGQLLRQGKIEKIAGGRFTVSDRISFKPDTRAVS